MLSFAKTIFSALVHNLRERLEKAENEEELVEIYQWIVERKKMMQRFVDTFQELQDDIEQKVIDSPEVLDEIEKLKKGEGGI
jgi:ATP-dependent RNA circularization protein (DNA/RNA ligase family)